MSAFQDSNTVLDWLERHEIVDTSPIRVAKLAVISGHALPPGDVERLLALLESTTVELQRCEGWFAMVCDQARMQSDRCARMPLMAAESARNMIRKTLGKPTIRITRT